MGPASGHYSVHSLGGRINRGLALNGSVCGQRQDVRQFSRAKDWCPGKPLCMIKISGTRKVVGPTATFSPDPQLVRSFVSTLCQIAAIPTDSAGSTDF